MCFSDSEYADLPAVGSLMVEGLECGPPYEGVILLEGLSKFQAENHQAKHTKAPISTSSDGCHVFYGQ